MWKEIFISLFVVAGGKNKQHQKVGNDNVREDEQRETLAYLHVPLITPLELPPLTKVKFALFFHLHTCAQQLLLPDTRKQLVIQL